MAKKILFVDDDPDWRLVVTACLKEAGYNVLAVRGASEALLQSGDAGLDLILLDLDLGGENGLMLMKFLKRNHPAVPIILYTGMKHDEEAIQRMRELGAQQYLRKGNMSELLAVIETILK
jgi:DNA-binding response OmpR family regulator